MAGEENEQIELYFLGSAISRAHMTHVSDDINEKPPQPHACTYKPARPAESSLHTYLITLIYDDMCDEVNLVRAHADSPTAPCAVFVA